MSLISYWIVPSQPNGPLGFGVTGHSLADALSLIIAAGYEGAVPLDLMGVNVTENVAFDELPRHVREHSGPIVTRGVWYPWPTPAWFGRA